MAEVKVKNNDLEGAIKKFKRDCAKEGINRIVKEKRYYKKPSVQKKEKAAARKKNKR